MTTPYESALGLLQTAVTACQLAEAALRATRTTTIEVSALDAKATGAAVVAAIKRYESQFPGDTGKQWRNPHCPGCTCERPDAEG